MRFRSPDRIVYGLSLLALGALALPARAQTTTLKGATCALPVAASGEPALAAPAFLFPRRGTINALVVFVQNENDRIEDDCFDSTREPINFREFPASVCAGQPDTPTRQSTSDDPVTEWPSARSLGPDRALPSWGASLLAAPGTAPAAFPAGSLSEYYRLNSGGRFTLTGYVYPKVYLPANGPDWYRANPGSFPNGGVRLSHEILTYVNANREGIPLGDASIFDRYKNGDSTLVPDGVFDMVILMFRSNNTCAYGSTSPPVCGNALASLGFVGDASSNGFSSDTLLFGGMQVRDNTRSGSGVWSIGQSRALAMTVTTHEIGHRHFGGNHAIDNPLSIMHSNGFHPAMFAATDRMQLGWVTTEEVQYSALAASPTVRTLGESLISGRALVIRNGPSTADLVVEARTQSSNVWDVPASTYGMYQDDDVYAKYLPEDALLIYKRDTDSFTSFAVNMSNAGLRQVYDTPFRAGSRLGFAPGHAYTPLSRIRYDFPLDGTLDRGFAITDISKSGTTFSFSLWRDFLTAPGVKTLGVNYTLANHDTTYYPTGDLPAVVLDDRNIARATNFILGGTFRFTGTLEPVGAGSPSLDLLPNTVLEVPAGAVVTLQGPRAPAQPFRIGAGANARIDVAGVLIAERVTLSASNATTGWGGLRFGPPTTGSQDTPPAAGSTLTNVTISGVRYPPAFGTAYPARAAVELQNRTVLLTGGTTVIGSTAANANGVQATGTAATVTVSGFNTSVSRNSGVGVLGTAGARVFVTGQASISENGLGGVRVSGYGTRATVDGYAEVNGNYGPGLVSESQAHVTVRSPIGLQRSTSVSNNRGGPTARSGGSIDGGQCDSGRATGRPNAFLDNYNHSVNPYDASARGGSSVVARYAFWGTGRTALALDYDGSSTIKTSPLATTASTPDPECSVAGRPGGDAGATWQRATRDPGSVAGRGRVVTEAVVALATAAREAAWAGDTTGAFATLTAAGDAAVSGDDREAVFEATAALLAFVQPEAALTALEAAAGSAGTDQPWARRALAVAYASSGRTADAEASAAVLTADAETAHAVVGHSVLVRLGVEADSAALAVTRLVAFAEIVAETDTLAVEAFGSAVAMVAAAFPDADLTGVTGGAGGRGVTAGETAVVEAKVDGSAVEDGLAVWPNPAASRGTVRLSVSTAARHATAQVYDALGRRVAVLHDGPLATGAHDFGFAASALAPGIYVVQVRVTPAVGAAWTEVRRMTVAR